MKVVTIGDVKIGDTYPFVLIAGPCVIEDEDTVFKIAHEIKEISIKNEVSVIFKSSFEKDNRSSIDFYRGPGLQKGLEILKKVKLKFDLPVVSDVHRESDVDKAKEVLDIIQVPAFLSQQTSLLLKVGNSGVPVNIKKGQFVSPENMIHSVNKVLSTGNDNILVTERGTCFGYNQLVFDVSSIPKMQKLGFPVISDVTHMIRKYGIPSSCSDGAESEYIPHLAKASVAAGCNGLFIETHTNPVNALCDASSMMNLTDLKHYVKAFIRIHEIATASII